MHKLFEEKEIDLFKKISDPLVWQQKQREEWS
jgi:hypothetical protein